MNIFRRLSTWVIVTSLLLCGGTVRIARAQDDVIHIGVSAFEAQADVYYALDLGLFKRAGLNVDIQQFQSGSVIVAAVSSGALEIGAGTPLPLAQARQRGIPIVLVAPGYIYDSAAATPIDALAVAAQSPGTTGKDLTNKTIGVTALRGIDQVAVASWIDQHGGDSSSVKFIEVPPSAVADAIVQGRVDAGEMGDPSLSAAVASGKVRIFAKAYDAVAKRFFAAAWFATEDWAGKHPDQIRKFNVAINEAAAWAVKNPEQAATVLQKYLHVTVPRAHDYHAASLDPALIQPILDGAAKYKLLPPMKAADLIWKG